jgi:hypothetical protein
MMSVLRRFRVVSGQAEQGDVVAAGVGAYLVGQDVVQDLGGVGAGRVVHGGA